MLTNVLLCYFLVGNGQELGIKAGRCLGAGCWFFLYIRTFTNALLCYFLRKNLELRRVGVWERDFGIFFIYKIIY